MLTTNYAKKFANFSAIFEQNLSLDRTRTVQRSALCRSRRELLFLERGGELRIVREDLSVYVRYCYVHLSKFSLFNIFQFLSMSLFLNLLFETDSYSNEYLVLFTCKIWLRYSRERALQSLPKQASDTHPRS